MSMVLSWLLEDKVASVQLFSSASPLVNIVTRKCLEPGQFQNSVSLFVIWVYVLLCLQANHKSQESLAKLVLHLLVMYLFLRLCKAVENETRYMLILITFLTVSVLSQI